MMIGAGQMGRVTAIVDLTIDRTVWWVVGDAAVVRVVMGRRLVVVFVVGMTTTVTRLRCYIRT